MKMYLSFEYVTKYTNIQIYKYTNIQIYSKPLNIPPPPPPSPEYKPPKLRYTNSPPTI